MPGATRLRSDAPDRHTQGPLARKPSATTYPRYPVPKARVPAESPGCDRLPFTLSVSSMDVRTTSTPTQVSVIIVNYLVEDRIARAVASVRNEPEVAEIIIVDNGSSAPLLTDLQQACPTVRVIESARNVGFASAANRGARTARSEFLFFLNPDAVAEPGCIRTLIDGYRARPGIVGPAIYARANCSTDVGATMNHLGMSVSLDGIQPPLYVSGCALFTSKHLFHELGGFDERYFLFVEDVELCWRALLAGYEVRAMSDARVVHEGGASAQGGYFTAGELYHTSVLRIALRERNTVALMITCAPVSWLVGVLPALLLRSLAIASVALCMRQPRLTEALVRGLAWNLGRLPSSLTRRRSLARCRQGHREAARRFVHRPVLLSMLWRSGLPKVSAGDALWP